MNIIHGSQNELTREQRAGLFRALRARFEKNADRHPGLKWDAIQARLEDNPGKLWSLNEMERTGGEPDVIDHDSQTDEYLFCDCAAESPAGRRNVCYDHAALEARKQARPQDSAVNMADSMGIELLTEEQYHALQRLGNFDTKTSSWLRTPANVRKPGGAIFGDRRFGRVFVYHNGADSYYAARGFRGALRV